MRSVIAIGVAACGVVVSLAGCPGAKPGGKGASGARNERLIDAVPGEAQAAAVIRRSALAVVHRLIGADPEMKQELAEFLTKRAGVDLTEVKGAVLFALAGKPTPAFGALLLLDDAGGMSLKGEPAGEHGGIKLHAVSAGQTQVVAGIVARGLVIGTRPGVVAAIDRLGGKGKALDEKSPLGGMLAADGPEVELIAGAEFAAGMPPKVLDAVQRIGVDDALFTMDAKRLLSLRLGGNAQRLSIAKRMLTTGLKRQLAMLKIRKQRATARDDLLAGVSAITSYHQMKRWSKELEPKLEGSQLVTRLQLPQDSAFYAVGMAGVLAAAAIPAFVRYQRRAKSVEATESLMKIKAGARAFFAADHYDPQGQLRPKSFPAGETGWLPKTPCCEQPGRRCQPDPAAWQASPWRELRFAPSEPHYYQYRYRASGDKGSARFEIEARGDLDCDGVYSSYKLTGKVGADDAVITRGPLISSEAE